jgi:Cys-tRNA(Pro)/Cys-tRNA(Cys) deacylase
MTKTNVTRFLEQQGIEYDTVVYMYDEDDLSLDKIAQDNGLEVACIFKTLVTQGSSGAVYVAVIAGNNSLSNKKFASLVGEKKIDLVSVKDLQNLTGYIRGGCSPLGMKKKYPVWIDETAVLLDWLYVNAGKRGLLFGCKPEDLLHVTQGNFADIAN